MTSTIKRAACLAAMIAATLVCGACRSDGGIGRREALRGMRWTLGTLEARHESDVENTVRNVDALGDWFADELSEPTDRMRRTMSLYLEGYAER